MSAAAKSDSEDGPSERGFQVEPRCVCEHSDALELPADGAYATLFDDADACRVCGDASEPWVCLTCQIVCCARGINGHMAEDSATTSHPIAAGLRDLSFWCFACDDYLDNFNVHALAPHFEILHTRKFGAPPPPREARRGGGARFTLELGAARET